MAIATLKTTDTEKVHVNAQTRPVTKTADSKGRVAIGSSFANRPVIVERISETEYVIKMARVIPESEAWLYENAVALNSVRKGLAQARAGEVVEGPDMAAGDAFADELED